LRIAAPRNYAHLDKSSESVRKICHDLKDSVAELGSNDV